MALAVSIKHDEVEGIGLDIPARCFVSIVQRNDWCVGFERLDQRFVARMYACVMRVGGVDDHNAQSATASCTDGAQGRLNPVQERGGFVLRTDHQDVLGGPVEPSSKSGLWLSVALEILGNDFFYSQQLEWL